MYKQNDQGVIKTGTVTKMTDQLQKQTSLEEKPVVIRQKVSRTSSEKPSGKPPTPLPRITSLRLNDNTSEGQYGNITDFTGNGAVQLYKMTDNGDYYLDMNVVKNVFGKVADKQIAIYSIAGKFRSGKSFILNVFEKYLKYGIRQNWVDGPITDSFKYKSTYQRVTTGIWIWSEPVIKKDETGNEIAVFLMDTQGWHDDQTSSQDSALVFSLSTLMSSVMIYNVEKRIGDDDLHYFQCFSSQAKIMEEKNNDHPFQRLVFLIRDWQFLGNEGFEHGYYDDYNEINGKNFKKELIDPRGSRQSDHSGDSHVSVSEGVREIIAQSYGDIWAYLLPNPGDGIQSPIFSSSAVNPLFVNHLKRFTSLLFNERSIVAKRIGGQLITGGDLITCAENWANEFSCDQGIYGFYNGTAGPTSEEAPYQMAYQTSLDYYDEKMKKYLNKSKTIEDFENLSAKQKGFMLQSQALFYASKKFHNNKLKSQFMKKLKGELDERESSYRTVIEHEIFAKKAEEMRVAKENELAQIMESDEFEDEEEKYGEMVAQVKKLIKIEDERKEIIRKTLYDFQQTRRTKRKNWFHRFICGIKKPFKKGHKHVKEANLIELDE